MDTRQSPDALETLGERSRPTIRRAVILILLPALVLTECAACALDQPRPSLRGQVTASGGQDTARTRHTLGPTPGLVRITYDRYDASRTGRTASIRASWWPHRRVGAGDRFPAVVLCPGAGRSAWCLVVYTLNCPET